MKSGRGRGSSREGGSGGDGQRESSQPARRSGRKRTASRAASEAVAEPAAANTGRRKKKRPSPPLERRAAQALAECDTQVTTQWETQDDNVEDSHSDSLDIDDLGNRFGDLASSPVLRSLPARPVTPNSPTQLGIRVDTAVVLSSSPPSPEPPKVRVLFRAVLHGASSRLPPLFETSRLGLDTLEPWDITGLVVEAERDPDVMSRNLEAERWARCVLALSKERIPLRVAYRGLNDDEERQNSKLLASLVERGSRRHEEEVSISVDVAFRAVASTDPLPIPTPTPTPSLRDATPRSSQRRFAPGNGPTEASRFVGSQAEEDRTVLQQLHVRWACSQIRCLNRDKGQGNTYCWVDGADVPQNHWLLRPIDLVNWAGEIRREEVTTDRPSPRLIQVMAKEGNGATPRQAGRRVATATAAVATSTPSQNSQPINIYNVAPGSSLLGPGGLPFEWPQQQTNQQDPPSSPVHSRRGSDEERTFNDFFAWLDGTSGEELREDWKLLKQKLRHEGYDTVKSLEKDLTERNWNLVSPKPGHYPRIRREIKEWKKQSSRSLSQEQS